MASRRLFPGGLLVLLALVLLWIPAFAQAAQDSKGLDDPAIKELMAMVEAKIADDVIMARLSKLAVPELTGQQLAELKKRGVSDRVLGALVTIAGRRSTPKPVPKPPAAQASPAPTGQKAPPEADLLPEGMGRVRIIFKSPFPVTRYEALIDGRRVAERGDVLDGESEPGQFLPRPGRIRIKGGETVYQGELPAGDHQILAGFAVSEVESDPNDEWSEFSRERYLSRGIRAAERAAAGKDWGANTPAVCHLKEGQTCVVTVTFGKRRTRMFGGRSAYTVRYKVTPR